jgi:hypothetical protein
MTVFVINIGTNIYDEYSLPLIKKLCEFNNVNLFILDKNICQNIYNLHPSWLKLFCFDLIDDDFIINWDLDLVPHELYYFKDYFDVNKLNLAYDTAFIREDFNFNGKFKYNCGLIGMPKRYSDDMKNIYLNLGKNSFYPSYEQYHVNDYIFDKKIDVNLIDSKLNTHFEGDESLINDNLNTHYTWRIKNQEHRIQLIKRHHEKYKNNFDL